jgi:hypothetical protein
LIIHRAQLKPEVFQSRFGLAMRSLLCVLRIGFGLALSSVALMPAQASQWHGKCTSAAGSQRHCASSRLSNAHGGVASRVKDTSRSLRSTSRKGRPSNVAAHRRPAPAAYDVTGSLPGNRENGRDLTAGELRQLYSGRTWVWSEGGGYFAPDGRFYAAVGSDAPSSYLARGKWQTGANGEMCFQALWNGQSGKSVERTCFYHKMVQGRILQKKGDAGAWYVFRGSSRHKDEFNKILPGDRIQSKFGEVRAKYLYGILM